jgi:site-specific DNA recombinase
MKAAVGYVRVSTEQQAREGVSLDMQISKIMAYCELNDMELVGIYGDPGISGKNIKARPGIQAVLKLAKSRKIESVVTYKLDRIARNTIQTLEIVDMMDKSGVALHSITEKLDTHSAIGRFVVRTLASLAEMERDLISERTSAALSEKRCKGEKTGGYCPYGLRAVNGKLEPDPAEQRVIHRMMQLRAKGRSYQRIADELTREGLLTRIGTPFRETQVIRILQREIAA